MSFGRAPSARRGVAQVGLLIPLLAIERRRTSGGRSTAPAAVYITLRRLEQKGLVASWMSEPAQERGGKSRRCVKVTKPGVKGLRAAREANDQMWKGLELLRKGSR